MNVFLPLAGLCRIGKLIIKGKGPFLTASTLPLLVSSTIHCDSIFARPAKDDRFLLFFVSFFTLVPSLHGNPSH